MFGRITIFKTFIKDFPSLSRAAFLAESEKPCSVCVKLSVLRGFVFKNRVLNPFIKDFPSLARAAFFCQKREAV